MSDKEKQAAICLFVALLKTTTDYSTFLIGELKQKPKHEFNVTIKQLDKLIAEIEKGLSKEDNELLESLNTDAV